MDTNPTTACCAPTGSTDLGSGEDEAILVSDIQNITSKADSALNIQYQIHLNDDSDDGDNKKPTVSVVIDDEDPHVSADNDHSEITSTTVEEVSNSFNEDHDYLSIRSVARNTSGYFGDNNEPFPVLEGLESYIGDDHEESNEYNINANLKLNQDQRRFRGLREEQHGRVTSSVPTVINTNAHGSNTYSRVQQVRTVFREGYAPVPIGGVRMQNRRMIGSQQSLPTVFNQRRIVHQGDLNNPPVMRLSNGRNVEQISGGYRFAGNTSGQNHRSGIVPGSNVGSYSTTAAIIANDPSRAANDVAPAPLIIPARGAKTIQRSRISTPNRVSTREGHVTINSSNYSSSPRKVYQLTRGVEYVPPPNDMHSYVKVPEGYETSSNTTNKSQQYIENSESINDLADPTSAAIINVDEEEAQNAKFFQRQSQGIGILPMREKHAQRISFSDNSQQLHENQQISVLKPTSNDRHLLSSSQQSRSPMGGRFRATHGSMGLHSIPSILQRDSRPSTGQMPADYSSSIGQDLTYTSHLDPDSVIASKQAQRPRGRPRGQRLSVGSSSSGSNVAHTHQNVSSDVVLNRQQQRIQPQQHAYNEQQPQQQLFSKHQLQESDRDINTSVSQYNQNHSLVTSPVNTANVVPHQDYIPQQAIQIKNSGVQQQSALFVYQQATQHSHDNQNVVIPINDYHLQQQQSNVEYVGGEDSALHHHGQLHNPNRHVGEQHQQYQRLEDLAELAQLSQKQHQQFTTAQRPIYQHTGGSPMYLPRSGVRSPAKQGRQLIETEHSLVFDEQQLANNQPQFFNDDQNISQQLQNYSPYGVYTENAADVFELNGQIKPPQDTISQLSVKKSQKPRISKPSKVVDFSKSVESNESKRNKKPTRRSKNDTDTEEDWEGEDYTTRCLCNMSHNDEFMIECERCNVWQHGVCMGVSSKNVPEMYFCELCQPRPLKHTRQQAATLQQRKFLKLENISKKPKNKKKQKLNYKLKRGKPIVTPKPSTSQKKSTGVFKNFIEITENQFSRSLRSFIQQTDNVGNSDLLTMLKSGLFARQMFVASNVEGLVATHGIAAGFPVIEYSGCFSLTNESSLRDKLFSKSNFILKYNGFSEENSILIDASKMGSAARFARRSCKPNTEIKHVIQDGRLHILLVAVENIDFSAEITIPFDYDYTTSLVPVNCACGATNDQYNDDDCDVIKFNLALMMTKKAFAENNEISPQQKSPISIVPKRKSRLVSTSSIESLNSRSLSRSPAKKLAPVTKLKLNVNNVEKKENESSSSTVLLQNPDIKKSKILISINNDVKSEVVNAPNISSILDTSNVAADIKPIKEFESSVRPRRSVRNVSPSVRSPKVLISESKIVPTVEKKPKIENSKSKPTNNKPKEKDKPSNSLTEINKVVPSFVSPIRKTRSAVAKEELKNEVVNPKTPAKFAEIASKSSPEATKLSREDRKLQEALAAIERLEQREKLKQERRLIEGRSVISSVKKPVVASLSASPAKNKNKDVEIKIKRSSRLASSSSSFSSNVSSGSVKRVTVVEPKKRKDEENLTPVSRRLLKRSLSANSLEKDLKKTRTENKQISHVEAAQLLTEMASGLKSDSSDNVSSPKSKVNEDIRAQIVRAAEIALVQKQIVLSKGGKAASAVEEFILGSDFKTTSSPLKRRQPGTKQQSAKQLLVTNPNFVEYEPTNVEAVKPLSTSTKIVKKVTLDEYRQRKSSVTSNANLTVDGKQDNSFTPKQPRTSSFMPSFKEVSANISLLETQKSPKTALLNIPLGLSSPSNLSISSVVTSNNVSEEAPSLDELKRRIYGGKQDSTKVLEADQSEISSTSKSALSSSVINDVSVPRLSLEERLQKQFGLGRETSSSAGAQSKTLPVLPKHNTLLTTKELKSNATGESKSQCSRLRSTKQSQDSSVASSGSFTISYDSSSVPPPPPSLNLPAVGVNHGRLGANQQRR